MRVEKALAGVASSGQSDSGVTARLFGTFLAWLNDRSRDRCVYSRPKKLDHDFESNPW
jgi:hypothetical protein